MENSQLLQFIKGKFQEPHKPDPGPVITISREYGCPGDALGKKLAKELSSKIAPNGQVNEWKSLGREIMIEASKQVNLTPEVIESITHHKPKSLFAEFFSSFSDYYMPDDIAIKKAVAGIILGIAQKGNVVIVGQAAAVLTDKFEKALHIRLIAPLPWRVNRVMAMHKCDEKKAQNMIDHIDRERIYLRHLYAGETANLHDFDVIFNAERMNEDAMLQSILCMLVQKKIIRGE